MITFCREVTVEATPLWTLAHDQPVFSPSPFPQGTHLPCLRGSVFQTVEEIEGVLGRDLYPSLAEERSRWEKELAGLREENESLTAMLCSKEEELSSWRLKPCVTLNQGQQIQVRGLTGEPHAQSCPGRSLIPPSRL